MIKYNYELLTTPKSKSRSKKTQSTPIKKSKSRKSSIKNNFPFSNNNNNNKSTKM